MQLPISHSTALGRSPSPRFFPHLSATPSMKLLLSLPITAALCAIAALISGSAIYLIARTVQHSPSKPAYISPSPNQLQFETSNEAIQTNSSDLWNLKQEFKQYQENLAQVESFAVWAETDLSNLKEQIATLQAELEKVKRDTQATQDRLQKLTEDSLTLAKCSTDVNELVDSIEKLTLTNVNLVEISRKAEGLKNSQTFRDGACRRSRRIAQRLLETAP